MASISTDKSGNRRIQFIAGDGKRRAIRIGKMDMKTTRDFARRVDALNVAMITGDVIGRELAEWLANIGEKFHDKLAAAGLVDVRKSAGPMPTLGTFLDDFIAKRAGEKESTLQSIRGAANRLRKFFGEDAPLDSINAGEADDWLLWMTTTKKYAGATISRTVKHAKRIFLSAVRLELLKASPFAHLKSRKQTNDSRKFFITPEVAVEVLESLPDAEWRLIFALSRYGGLRCPSEHLALTWADFDWDGDKFLVRAPKTGDRWVPIFAELRPYLDAAWDAAPEGAVHVITKRRLSAQRWGILLERILAKSGISIWPKIFHNLRASRQTELTAIYSIGTVCRWLGNSIEIADAHYLTAMESEFKRAAKEGAIQKALQNPVQQTTTNNVEPLQTSTVPVIKNTGNIDKSNKNSGRPQFPGGLGTIRRSRKVRHLGFG